MFFRLLAGTLTSRGPPEPAGRSEAAGNLNHRRIIAETGGRENRRPRLQGEPGEEREREEADRDVSEERRSVDPRAVAKARRRAE